MAHHEMAHEPRDPADYTGADAQYFETPAGAEYEHTDASVGIIVKFGFWLLVSTVVVHIGVGFAYSALIAQSRSTAEPRFPLAAGREQALPTAPRLQQDPAEDLLEFRQEEAATLENYGWISRDAGTVRIPIDEAMRRVLEQGLPAREDTADGFGATSGLLASDSSSGRIMERPRQ